ncbi:MAG: hypothetical protein HY063_00725 [Bacteroidetes bacterium]|nr:hypothetical protein [Bacteroidota bacterium]
MKKTFSILFIAFAFWIISSAGLFSQSIDSAEYFFDADPGVTKGFPLSITPGDSLLDSVYINVNGLNAVSIQFFSASAIRMAYGVYTKATGFIFTIRSLPLQSLIHCRENIFSMPTRE